MKSIQHVLWRGALALSLMAVGLGTGLGMPPAQRASAPGDCPASSRGLVATERTAAAVRGSGGSHGTRIVLRRAFSPAG